MREVGARLAFGVGPIGRKKVHKESRVIFSSGLVETCMDCRLAGVARLGGILCASHAVRHWRLRIRYKWRDGRGIIPSRAICFCPFLFFFSFPIVMGLSSEETPLGSGGWNPSCRAWRAGSGKTLRSSQYFQGDQQPAESSISALTLRGVRGV